MQIIAIYYLNSIEVNMSEKVRGFGIVSKYKDESDTIKMPKRGTMKSACYDIFNNTGADIELDAGHLSSAIPTKIKSYMQDDEVLIGYVRSGHGFKYSVRLANSNMIVDSDFYKELPIVNKKGEITDLGFMMETEAI